MDKIRQKSIWVIIKIFIALFAVSNNSLAYVEYGYPFDIPVLKWVYAMFKEADAIGMTSVLMLLGLGMIFWSIRTSVLQNDKWICLISSFFAFSTVLGKSYYELGNWDYIFHGRIQFGLAIFVMLGYYWVYKNCIILVAELINRKPMIFRGEGKGIIEKYLFEKHAFLLPLCVFSLLLIPYYVAFFPGTIHADATMQLYQHFGLLEFTGHHPVLVTKLMGICIEIGKALFHSDNMGMALYIMVQTICQLLIFSYTIWILCRMKVPMIFRWMTLLLYGVFPLFPMYAITMSKDTGYYNCMLLFVVSLVYLCWGNERKLWWNKALLVIGSVGVCMFRKEGKYIVIIALLAIIYVYRQKWKICLISLCFSLTAVFAIEGVYMSAKGIAKGGVGEMLSIPLQQTARYIKEHYYDLPEEEKEQLQEFFTDDLFTIAEIYDPEISDPVKNGVRLNWDDGSISMYLKVWFQGLLKHPDTYIQAYLNHTYGYFYPDRGCHDDNVKCFFNLVGGEQWETSFMNVCFVMKDSDLRCVIQEYVDIINRLPVLKLLFSPGAYVYVLLGCLVYLLRKKQKNSMCILLPSVLIVAVCLISPVNAYLRYTFPLIVLTPVNLMWCYMSDIVTDK